MGRRSCYLVLALLGAGYFFLFLIRTPWHANFYHLISSNLSRSVPYDGGGQEVPNINTSIKWKVLIISYPRSGTSFLGDLFNSHPHSFYHFEPLHVLGVVRNQTKEAVSLLKSLFNCQFPPRYLKWIKLHPVFKMMERNGHFWRTCHRGFRNVTCYRPDAASRFCRNQTLHVAKVIRLPMGLAEALLEAIPDLKIIYNVRDPRGLLNSRLKSEIYTWCKLQTSCIVPKEFCQRMLGDLKSYCALRARYNSRIFFIRYEDVAINPMEYARRLFSWLGFDPLPQETARFVRTHTSISNETTTTTPSPFNPPYQTMRQSNLTAFAWQRELDPLHLQVVSRACQEVIEKFWYPTNSNFTDYSGFGKPVELSCPPNG